MDLNIVGQCTVTVVTWYGFERGGSHGQGSSMKSRQEPEKDWNVYALYFSLTHLVEHKQQKIQIKIE